MLGADMADTGNNAILRLHSTQGLDGETHQTDLNSTCCFEYTPDKVTIRYKESGLDENNAPDTVITVLPRQVVTIQRVGDFCMDLLLEEGVTHRTAYSVPEGQIPLTIYTEKVRFHFDESGGMMLVRYSLDLNDMIHTTHSIRFLVEVHGDSQT
ncbi:MAG: DUF1934 domain-containing protein [Oscillospiraceae bacterium]|nr:DUF1934 domain-containing protein [Oscillospiraceae bacterium]